MSSPSGVASFFRSRFVDRPRGTSERESDELPAGFRAAGISCGIKSSGDLDLGLLVCDLDGASSWARFTRNSLVAAPVTVSRRADLRRLRAVVVNSGNANVANGEAGLAVAEATVATAATALELPVARIGVASTGVIGLGLERTPVLDGVAAAIGSLSTRSSDFAQAILTTDRWAKRACLDVDTSNGTIRLCAQAKGGGMISPSFATMLCFVQTDAALDEQTLQRLLDAAIERSFERISVDGQLSTNDSVFMIASGGSGTAIEPGGDDELTFAHALDALLKQLALEIVADGEGATRVARLEVSGPASATALVARGVANSSLVRCALYGGDPNWGRILAAAGQALPGANASDFGLAIGGVEVARSGAAVPLEPSERESLERLMQEPEVELHLSLGSAQEQSEIFFCDLGHEYVRINAEYS
jgi:glutamate N-acetyltransferase/amino-acid N-acetyltransferase